MEEVREIGRLLERAIEAETGNPYGIANLVGLGALAIAAVADSLQSAIVYLAVQFGRGALYVFDLIAEFVYRRNGLVWIARRGPMSRVPMPGSTRVLSWVFVLAVFCPAGLLIQSVA